ncbi:MAG: hypothetical protein LQ343_000580 [Gyalolechia ehrenbergii]|nr:MAG: hypothetical protein LQ343_000580 [Gyalolechia ehrenbergii]
MYAPLLAGITILVTSLLAYFNPGSILWTLGSGEEGVFSAVMWKNPFTKASIYSFADLFVSLQADIIIPTIFPGSTSCGGPYIMDKAAHLTNLTMAAPVYPPLPNYTLSPHVLYPMTNPLHGEGLSVASLPWSFWMWSIAVLLTLVIGLSFTVFENISLRSELACVAAFEDVLWDLFSITKDDSADTEVRLRELVQALESQGLGRDPYHEDLMSHISFVIDKTRAAHLISCLTIELNSSTAQRDAALDKLQTVNQELPRLQSTVGRQVRDIIARTEQRFQGYWNLFNENNIAKMAQEEQIALEQQRNRDLVTERDGMQQKLDYYQDRHLAHEAFQLESKALCDLPLPETDDSDLIGPSEPIDHDADSPSALHNIPLPETDDTDLVEQSELIGHSEQSPSTATPTPVEVSPAESTSASEGTTTPGKGRKKQRKGRAEYNAQKLRLRKEEAEYVAKHGKLIDGSTPIVNASPDLPPPASAPGTSPRPDSPQQPDTAPVPAFVQPLTPRQRQQQEQERGSALSTPQPEPAPAPESAPGPATDAAPTRPSSPPSQPSTVSEDKPVPAPTTPFVQPQVKPRPKPIAPLVFVQPTPPSSGRGGGHSGRGDKRGRGGRPKYRELTGAALEYKKEVEAAEREAAEKAAQQKASAANTTPVVTQPEPTPVPKSPPGPASDAAPVRPSSPSSQPPAANDGRSTPPAPTTPVVQPQVKPRPAPIAPLVFVQPAPLSSGRGRGGGNSGRGGQRGRGGERGRGGGPKHRELTGFMATIKKEREEADEAAEKAAREKK